jgi:predicted metal-dependent HD superfamily phosphohydrolase
MVELDRMHCGGCKHEELCDDWDIKGNWNERVEPVVAAHSSGIVLPRVRFHELWKTLGAEGHGHDVLVLLRAAYAEPQRAYHDARHISACLRLLDDPAVAALATHRAEVEAALWFHDAIYDPRATDNEEQSAQLVEIALEGAQVVKEVIARIADHVRATKHHTADSADGQLVLDIDLSILGQPPEVYERFEVEIRREYAWVDAAAYAAGRAAVLLRFDEREHIYRTPLFRERFEEAARKNIAAAIAKLAPG